MSLRSFIFLLAVCGLIGACKNEPYATTPLGIIGLVNHTTNITSTFKYRKGELYSYAVGTSSTRFAYKDGILEYMIGDSTATSYKVTQFYTSTETTSIDSTFVRLANASGVFDSEKAIATRTIQYDNAHRPLSVYVKTWTDEKTTSQELAELTWDDAGNVSAFRYTDQLTSVTTNLSIGYDDRSGVYAQGPDYVFVLPLSGMYHLSVNNPLTFNNGAGERTYTYWYNAMGYPSNFQSDTNVVFGVSYTQMR